MVGAPIEASCPGDTLEDLRMDERKSACQADRGHQVIKVTLSGDLAAHPPFGRAKLYEIWWPYYPILVLGREVLTQAKKQNIPYLVYSLSYDMVITTYIIDIPHKIYLRRNIQIIPLKFNC